MWLTRRFTILSFPAIARLYNRTDHTTVMHACKAHEKRLEAGETFPQIPGWEV
ncbi:hypothetical protein GL4_2909 [Methyloceanibacter caenitepidi]|uniref:Chromosomal replication initiator DnaA C-terminal domain-containing protein n=2 Tax=Methyloceanibacter caenitepidi TaxID=1384459 RepID=A0A0A8K761_9HYPH|nr:hypothetical protein GL4_2909 [Methyloceanibacter caenitepidi]